jgi:hypothetical protein
MSKPVVYLKEIERVGDVIETLQTTTHNLFPILSIFPSSNFPRSLLPLSSNLSSPLQTLKEEI